MMKPVIMQQIVMNLSILAAVMLSLHNFITNLTAGRFGVEVHESTDERSKTSGARSHLRPGEPSAGFRPGKSNKSKAWAQANEWEDSDRASHGSQENIIMQTMTWQVSRNDEAVGSSVPGREAELETPPLERKVGKARARNLL
jgi:hypothetical protein